MIAPCPDTVVAWRISPELALRLYLLDSAFRQSTGRELTIISGYRTCEEQMELAAAGRPAASCQRSTHVSCPATGADLRMDGLPAASLKLELGRLARLFGLRWGGGSPSDSSGIPSDWNHFDLGPRQHG